MFSWFSYTWILLPMLALSKQLGQEVPGFGWIIFGILFFSLISGAIGGSRAEKNINSNYSLKKRFYFFLLFTVTILYSESLIFASAEILGTNAGWEKAAGIFWLCIAYFPFRYQLFYRPPYSILDACSMIGTMIYFLYEFLGVY